MTSLTFIIIVGIGILFMGAAAFFFVMLKLSELHLSTNSRLDELLSTTKSLARAEGFKAGQENHLDELRRAGAVLDDESKHGG